MDRWRPDPCPHPKWNDLVAVDAALDRQRATKRLSITINQSGVALAAWSEGGLVELYGYGGPPATGYLYSRWNGSAWAAPVPMTGRLVAMRGNLAYLATSQRTLLRSIDAGATWAGPVALPQSYLVPDDMKIDSQGQSAYGLARPDTERGVCRDLYWAGIRRTCPGQHWW